MQCDTECGLGNRSRNVSCINNSTKIIQPSHACDYNLKPKAQQTCVISQCDETKELGKIMHPKYYKNRNNKQDLQSGFAEVKIISLDIVAHNSAFLSVSYENILVTNVNTKGNIFLKT